MSANVRIKSQDMTRIHSYAGLLICALICTSCKPNLNSRGYAIPGTNGLQYYCEIIEPQSKLFSRQTPLTVLVARVGGGRKEYPLTWESKNGRRFVDGKPLVAYGNVPVLYYKENGRLKSGGFSNSPIWSVFLAGTRPTEKELARVFEALEESRQTP